MEKTEYTIIIEFRYGIEADEPFYELVKKLYEIMDKPDAPGKYDGHEISMDNFDARFYFYSYHPQQTLTYIDEIFKTYHFLIGGRIYIHQTKYPDGYTDTEIIATNGIRTPLSKFDADQLSHIPDWGERGSSMYDDSEEGDEWKGKLKNERAEKLYNKWKEIDYIIEAIWDKWDLSAPETTKPKNEGTEDPLKIEGVVVHKVEKDSDDDEDESFTMPREMLEWDRQEMRGNSYLIPAKISGAEAGDLYIIRMENAAIIRKAAQDVYLDCHSLSRGKVGDPQDIELLRSEIRQFKEYFKEWVNGFERDEFGDDWGLFK